MNTNRVNYYKIVETRENDVTQLSPVPCLWEKDGKLMWPPKNKIDKALKVPFKSPGTITDGWTEFDCIVKRSYIPTYSEALKEINLMSNKSDTSESECSFQPVMPINKRSAGARKIVPYIRNADDERSNFNELCYDYKSSKIPSLNDQTPQEQHQMIPPPVTIAKQTSMQQLIPPLEQSTIQQQTLPLLQEQAPQQSVYFVGYDNDMTLVPPYCADETVNPVNTLESMISALVESNAKLHTKLEYSINLQEQILTKWESSSLPTSTTNAQINVDNSFELIDSIEQLETFEENLRTTVFVEELCPKFYSICGPTSGLYGDDVCYKLVDSIFSRRLLTQVSWTGVSRSGTKKENFSRFVRTFKFFHELVRRCDPNITETNLKKFFKKIMDNSTRRHNIFLSQTPKRSSAVKHQSTVKRKRNKIEKLTENVNSDPTNCKLKEVLTDGYNESYLEDTSSEEEDAYFSPALHNINFLCTPKSDQADKEKTSTVPKGA